MPRPCLKRDIVQCVMQERLAPRAELGLLEPTVRGHNDLSNERALISTTVASYWWLIPASP